MQALISPNEPVQSGYRVAQVELDGGVFPVAEPLFWKECPDDVVADMFWYDPATESFKLVEFQPTHFVTTSPSPNEIPQSIL